MADRGTSDHQSVLIEHIRLALIHSIGARRVDVWLGKDGLVQYDVRELAEIAVRSLEPLFERAPAAASVVAELHDRGILAPPLKPHDPNDW